MTRVGNDWRLRGGIAIILLAIVLLMVVLAITFFNPMRGEEEFAGTTFAEIETNDPQLAKVIWHYNAALTVTWFGLGATAAVLAFKALPARSRIAWYAIGGIGLLSLVTLLISHAPPGHPSVDHWGPFLAVTLVLLAGLALAARPVLGRSPEPRPPTGSADPARR